MSNTIHMQARLGKDPEVREFEGGSVCRLWLAESETWKDKSGEKQEHTNWWSAEIWGKGGEVAAKYFNKGDGIVISGSLRNDVVESDDGSKKTYTKIRVSRWEFPMSKKGDGESSSSESDSGGDGF